MFFPLFYFLTESWGTQTIWYVEKISIVHRNIDMHTLFLYHFITTSVGCIQYQWATVDQAYRDHFFEKEMSFGEGNKSAIMGTREPLSNPFQLLWFQLGDGKCPLLCICYVGSKPLFFIGMFYLGWWSYKKYFVKLLCPRHI